VQTKQGRVQRKEERRHGEDKVEKQERSEERWEGGKEKGDGRSGRKENSTVCLFLEKGQT